ncbi:MAG: hypothetical protein ACI9SC_001137 [Gammaproteobacteria bacterium]|jgi:hypothetical protein
MVELEMNIIGKPAVLALMMTIGLGGCMSQAPVKKVAKAPEHLYIYDDGSMEFRNRPIDAGEVVIYADGRGGEKAAVKISMAPIHPPFFRDSIIVVRKPTNTESVAAQ